VTTAAAATKVDPEQLPKVECTSLHYSQGFLAKFPKAPAACLEARVYKGQTYMKVKAKVYIAEKDTPTTVAFLDTYGNSLVTHTVKDPKNVRVIMNDEDQDFESLRKGEIITVWVPEAVYGG
jgi:hypothetical protein